VLRRFARQAAEQAMQGRLFKYLFILSIAFLSFVLGALIATANLPPNSHLLTAFKGAGALYHIYANWSAGDDLSDTTMWYPSRTPEKGVTVNDPARADQGLTLYTSGHAQSAFLIDMAGATVHQWTLPYSEIWDTSGEIRDPVPDRFIFWRKARLLPNGDLLALYVAHGRTPWGYGLAKMDKDSTLIWKYLGPAHHDMDIADDGRIYTLTHRIRQHPVDGAPWIHMPVIADSVAVLSPDGSVEREIDLLDAIRNSIYAAWLTMIEFDFNGDSLHANAIDVVDAGIADRFPFARPGQVLLSFRQISALVVLDIETEQVVWALRGPWNAQHDPDLLANGNILVFDNLGHIGEGGASRVIEFDPLTQEIEWNYSGDAATPLESRTRSAQQRLANGNTLITESDAGRILEVSADGDIVWEYVNPERLGDDGTYTPVVLWAQRHDPSALTFGQFSRDPSTTSTQ
jgi:hypothetical protein